MQRLANAKAQESRLDQVRAELADEADALERVAEGSAAGSVEEVTGTGRVLKRVNLSGEDHGESFRTHADAEKRRMARATEERMNELLNARPAPKDSKFLNDTQNIQAQFGTSFKSAPPAQGSKLKDLLYDPPAIALAEVPQGGVVQLFLLDIVEETIAPFCLHLIGRVQHKKGFTSVRIRVKDSRREFYVIPRKDHSAEDTLAEIQAQIGGRKIRGDFKTELALDIVGRRYCFEYAVDLRGAERPVVRGTYPFRLPPLASLPAEGETYSGVFGLNYSCLELFQLRHRTVGPGWYELHGVAVEREELVMDDRAGAVAVLDRQDAPPLTVAGIQVLQSENGKEIAEIGLSVWAGFEMEKGRWATVDNVRYRRAGAAEAEPAAKPGEKNTTFTFENEYSMLSDFAILLSKVDPDVVLGHDFFSGCLDALYLRLESKFAEPNGLVARVPTKKVRSNNVQTQVRALFAGRLLADVFAFARETEKMEDYSLPSLYVQFVDKTARSVDVSNLRELNACLVRVARTLQILPLTLQLSKVAGCLWAVSLRQARSERNEMLLMHSFWQKGYIVPERPRRARDGEGDADEKKSYSGGMVLDPVSGLYTSYVVLVDFNSLYPSIIRNFKICFTTVRRKFKNFKEQYLEEDAAVGAPRLDVEEDVLGLAAPEEADEIADPLAEIEADPATRPVLPDVLTFLVHKRREVKALMKACKNDAELVVLDVRQKAYKLIANSIYGCLGFASSRFYARKMALLVTTFGRRLLINSKKFIEAKGFRVVYGDTDSIMIDTTQTATLDAVRSGFEIKREINSQFRRKSGEEQILEVELDGVFKKLLLLKKKKYAGLALKNFLDVAQGRATTETLAVEVKGLDLVRRDWSGVTRAVSERVLRIMLDTGDLAEVNSYLLAVRDALDAANGRLHARYGGAPAPAPEGPPSSSAELDFGLRDFVIKKQLNKKPSEYKEAAGLPHVRVARYLQAQGQTEEQLVNHFIPYVIVRGEGALADRAMHPDEFSDTCASPTPPALDIEWYKVNQVIAPIERLVEVVDPLCKDTLPALFGLRDAPKQDGAAEERSADAVHAAALRALNGFYAEGRDLSVDLLRVPCTVCNKYCLGYLPACATAAPPVPYSDAEAANRFDLMLANLVRAQLKTTRAHAKCGVTVTQMFVDKCPRCGKELPLDSASAAKRKYANLAYVRELTRASFGPRAAPFLRRIDRVLNKDYETNITDAFRLYAAHFPVSRIQLVLNHD